MPSIPIDVTSPLGPHQPPPPDVVGRTHDQAADSFQTHLREFDERRRTDREHAESSEAAENPAPRELAAEGATREADTPQNEQQAGGESDDDAPREASGHDQEAEPELSDDQPSAETVAEAGTAALEAVEQASSAPDGVPAANAAERLEEGAVTPSHEKAVTAAPETEPTDLEEPAISPAHKSSAGGAPLISSSNDDVAAGAQHAAGEAADGELADSEPKATPSSDSKSSLNKGASLLGRRPAANAVAPAAPSADATAAQDPALTLVHEPDAKTASRDRDGRPDQPPTTGSADAADARTGDRNAPAPQSRFAEQLARGGERGEKPIELGGAQQARFVDRVARALQAAEGRGESLRLRLHPPELGALRLELKVQNGALTARLEAETSSARSLLLDNLPVLRERLAEQGVRIEQFDVDLHDRESGSTAENQHQQFHQQESSQQSDPQPGQEIPDDGESVSQATLPWQEGDEQIDVKI